MDKALKQRLVGASVLIALAVIVLPMLLGGRPEGGAQGPDKIELPQQPPELSFETRRYPIGESGGNTLDKTPDNESSGPVTGLPAPRNTVAEIRPLGEGPGTTPGEEQSDQAAEEISAATAEEKNGGNLTDPDKVTEAALPDPLPEQDRAGLDSGRYIVQVASFGAPDNARRLSATLGKDGYFVMTDSVKSDVGTLHRVRVGPYDSETEASQVVAALESSINGVKPRVMDLKPEQAAQVTTPADPLVRWVVQVGSFSSAANAENLVASLRLEGQTAYQETINSSGSEIYRVRIGPFLVRDQAIQTERRVREKMSLPGVVMSAD